jgi:uncharacterized damage-inducible protein DinB
LTIAASERRISAADPHHMSAKSPERAGSTLREETNMKRVIGACVLVGCLAVVLAASPVFAQTPPPTIVKELVATWQRAGTDIIDIAEAMPEDKYGYKPTAEMSTFRDQLMHVTGIAQRFIDSAKGVKSAEHAHKDMSKAEVISQLKQTLQAGQETLGSLTDAQLLEQVKFPFGDRMVTRFAYWLGPIYQFRNHHGQLVVYLRLNGIVPPTTARRPS